MPATEPVASPVSKVTAPAASGQLASTGANVPQGMQRVDVYVSFTATAPAAADAANLNLRLNGTVLWAVAADPILNTEQLFTYFVNVSSAGSTIDLIAIGAGTAAVVYQTQIIATPE